MARGKREEAQALIAETGESKDQLKKLEESKEALQARRESLLYQIPNIPDPSVPVGKTPEENEVFKEWGERLDETWRKPHWELAEQKDWIDFERGAKVTGAGFPFYVGDIARLQRALINFFINEAAGDGCKAVQAPVLIRGNYAKGTGQ